jgi:hypothetical protein
MLALGDIAKKRPMDKESEPRSNPATRHPSSETYQTSDLRAARPSYELRPWQYLFMKNSDGQNIRFTV